jgi:hypothetical protein
VAVKCGSIDPSVANLDLWIKPTLFLRSGSFAAMFPHVTEAWRLVRTMCGSKTSGWSLLCVMSD